MRLKCEVDVVLRLMDGSSVRKTGRASQAIITVGKEGGSQSNSKAAKINMLISTGKNRSGTKYQVCVLVVICYLHTF